MCQGVPESVCVTRANDKFRSGRSYALQLRRNDFFLPRLHTIHENDAYEYGYEGHHNLHRSNECTICTYYSSPRTDSADNAIGVEM